jgi:hypothetical protein
VAVRAANQQKDLVSSAGGAVVAAAKVGRIFGRGYVRIARQLPGVALLEREAGRLVNAVNGARRVLPDPSVVFAAAGNADEQRVMVLLKDAHTDKDPLRTAMSELLARAADTDRSTSREYLFGTIVSQLVPDEARIVATLAGGGIFAAADVVAKPVGRSVSHTVLANASTLGHLAGVTLPDNTPTYITRLHAFGLIEFGPSDDTLGPQYDALAADPVIVAARHAAEAAKQGAIRIRRKTVTLSSLGRDFWAASAPNRLS